MLPCSCEHSVSSISTSTIMDWRLSRVTCILPRVFFRVFLVNPMRCSQKPPNQGARFGMNLHSTPLKVRVSENSGDVNNGFSSSAAAKRVEPLSDNRNLGTDRLPTNLRNAWRKISTLRSKTISRWNARESAHVNKQMYTLRSPSRTQTYNAPVN